MEPEPVAQMDDAAAASAGRPLRVLMVTSEWPSEDRPHAVPFLVRQVEHLRSAGVSVRVFAFRGGGRVSNYWRAKRELREVVARERFDLVHAQFGQSALAAPPEIPLVITFRGCELNGLRASNGRRTVSGFILRTLCRQAARRAAQVVVVSRHMLGLLPPGTSATVIPSGLDFGRLPLVPVAEARQRLGWPLDQRLVLFAGDPGDSVKRYPLAVRAMEALKDRMEARLIVMAGRPQEDMVMALNASDVLLLTSWQEGSPNVVKEALACNLPVVSVAVGDVSERLAGVDGCVVCEEDSAEAIAVALEKVLQRGERTCGRESVRDLDEVLLTRRLLGVYETALTQGVQRHPAVADAAFPSTGEAAG